MAFAQRQLNEIYSLIEVSFATVNPGAITTGSKAAVTVNPVVGGAGSGNTLPSQCILGDFVQAIPSAAAGAPGGLIITATVSANGTIIIGFYNAGAGTVTLTSAVWTFVTKRLVNVN